MHTNQFLWLLITPLLRVPDCRVISVNADAVLRCLWSARCMPFLSVCTFFSLLLWWRMPLPSEVTEHKHQGLVFEPSFDSVAYVTQRVPLLLCFSLAGQAAYTLHGHSDEHRQVLVFIPCSGRFEPPDPQTVWSLLPILLWMVFLVMNIGRAIESTRWTHLICFRPTSSMWLGGGLHVYYDYSSGGEGRFMVLMSQSLFQPFLAPSRSEMCLDSSSVGKTWVWMWDSFSQYSQISDDLVTCLVLKSPVGYFFLRFIFIYMRARAGRGAEGGRERENPQVDSRAECGADVGLSPSTPEIVTWADSKS